MRDDIDRKHFEKLLVKRRTEILQLQETQRGDGAPRELDQTRVGRLSRMDAMQQQAMSREAARLMNFELQRITTALERIASEEYGYCVLCDEEIALKRLMFDPSLLTCIDCAQQAEK